MAIIDLHNFTPPIIKNIELWSDFLDTVSDELDNVRVEIEKKNRLFEVELYDDVYELISIARSLGYKPNLILREDIDYVRQEVESIVFKIKSRATYAYYNYIFKLIPKNGAVYILFQDYLTLVRAIDWSTTFTNLFAHDITKPFTGVETVLHYDEYQDKPVELDALILFYLDSLEKWYLDQDIVIKPTQHLAIEYRVEELLQNEDNEDCLMCSKYLQYLKQGVDYGRKVTNVPHIGFNVSFMMGEQGFFDTYSEAFNESLTDSIPNDTLVAHYSLDDGEGVQGAVATYHLDGNALDMSGNGNHMPSEPWNYIEGISNNGIGAPFTASVTLPMKRTPAFTWALWTRWTGINSSYTYPTVLTDVSSHTYVGINHSGYGSIIYGEYGTDSSNYADHLGLEHFDLSDLQWHFFVMTYDGIDQIKVYDNGKFRDSATNVLNPDLTHDLKLSLSAHNDQNEYDEINIFDRALSSAEIKELYNNPANTNLNPPILPTEGLVGQWDLNGDALDTSGNGNDGVEGSTTTYAQGRKDNQAAVFDGTANSPIAWNNPILGATQFTVSVWVKKTAFTEYQGIVADYDVSDNDNFILGYESPENTIRFYVGEGTSNDSISVANVFTQDIWHHIVGVFNGDSGWFSLWVDGTETRDETLTITQIGTTQSAYSTIGAYKTYEFNGGIEGLKFFNRALSEQEILALAEQTNPVKDNSNKGNTGLIQLPYSNVDGKYNKGIDFSGNFSGINIGDLSISGDGTITTWFRSFSDTGRYQTILDQSSDTKVDYQIFLYPVTGYLGIKIRGVFHIIETNYIDDTLHFLVVKMDANDIFIYIDDVQIYTSSNLSSSALTNDYVLGNKRNSSYLEEKSFIGEAYTNLVQDPTDLTTANWSSGNGVNSSSTSLFINGLPFTKLVSDGFSGSRYTAQIISLTGNSVLSVILKHGNSLQSSFCLYDVEDVEFRARLSITWSTKTVEILNGLGKILNYTWFDYDTVEVQLLSENVVPAHTNEFLIYPDYGNSDSAYCYATACQLVDNTTTMFPFVDGTHSADVINEEFTMPGVFAVDMIVEPKFAYNTSISGRFLSYYVDSDSYLNILYYASADQIIVQWKDNESESLLSSQTFDDGSSYTNINQKIRIISFLNLKSPTQDNSMNIVIPLEIGNLNQDDLWNNTNPNIKITEFPIAYVGSQSGYNQANSDFEYLRIYSWDGVKPTITSSEDADAYFASQSLPLFSREFKNNYMEADVRNKGYNFNGILDEVRFYNSVLTTGETTFLLENPENPRPEFYTIPDLKITCSVTDGYKDSVPQELIYLDDSPDSPLDEEPYWSLDQETEIVISQTLEERFNTLAVGTGKKNLFSKNYISLVTDLNIHMSFEDKHTTTFIDNAINNYTAEASGTFTLQQGISGKTVYYNGTDTELVVSGFVSSSSSKDINFWVIPESTGQVDTNPRFIYQSGYIDIFYNTTGETIDCVFYGDSGNITASSNSIPVTTFNATTYFISVKIDSDNDELTFYIDNNQQGSVHDISTIGLYNSANDLYFGSKNGSNFFTGKIDEFRVYSKNLTDIDRQYLFDKRLGSLRYLDNEVFRKRLSTNQINSSSNWNAVVGTIPANTVNNERIALGDGTTKHFTGTLDYTNLYPGYLTLRYYSFPNWYDVTTNTKGEFVGSAITGTINYVTGTYDFTTEKSTQVLREVIASQTSKSTLDYGMDNSNITPGTCHVNYYISDTQYDIVDVDNLDGTGTFTGADDGDMSGTTGTITYATGHIAMTFGTATDADSDIYTAYTFIADSTPSNNAELLVEYKLIDSLEITEAAIINEQGEVSIYATFPKSSFDSVLNHIGMQFFVKKIGS